jgi:hypothetical protein
MDQEVERAQSYDTLSAIPLCLNGAINIKVMHVLHTYWNYLQTIKSIATRITNKAKPRQASCPPLLSIANIRLPQCPKFSPVTILSLILMSDP